MQILYIQCCQCRLHYPISPDEVVLFWQEIFARHPVTASLVDNGLCVMQDLQRGFAIDVFIAGKFVARHIDSAHLMVPERPFAPAEGWYDKQQIKDKVMVVVPR